MPEIVTQTLDNGLPVHRIALEGTRAVTLLVAFDAGARTERPEENGMAHFLEHLVFKGGEKFAHYRDVNETAERLGARAQRLHVARHRRLPHHGARRAGARGRRPADRLRGPAAHRRRRARPRARRGDPGDRALPRPALDAGRGPDRPGRLRRPPAGAAGARPRGPPAHVYPRRHRGLPRAALVGPPRGRVPGRQPRSAARERGCGRAVRPLPGPSRADRRTTPLRRSRPRSRSNTASPTSRTCA